MTTECDDNMKCAACGREGDGLKTCNGCKLVKYCNATCQKVHRPQHKKECRKRAAELHDEALFKEPPPGDECPICMLPLPISVTEQKYQECCGKMICMGCIHAAFTADDRCLCPFCRIPHYNSNEEIIERLQKRAEANDAVAFKQLGCRYDKGDRGFPQDRVKAMEHWLRAGTLGCSISYYNVGNAYYTGEGVERDMAKAIYYYELAAMGGDVHARNNLGSFEGHAGNMDRAVKHFMIAAGAGFDGSLTNIRRCFMDGHATKDDFEKALRAHKKAKDEMKSDQREIASAIHGRN